MTKLNEMKEIRKGKHVCTTYLLGKLVSFSKYVGTGFLQSPEKRPTFLGTRFRLCQASSPFFTHSGLPTDSSGPHCVSVLNCFCYCTDLDRKQIRLNHIVGVSLDFAILHFTDLKLMCMHDFDETVLIETDLCEAELHYS